MKLVLLFLIQAEESVVKLVLLFLLKAEESAVKLVLLLLLQKKVRHRYQVSKKRFLQ